MHFTFILPDHNPRSRDFGCAYANARRKNCVSLASTKMQPHVDEWERLRDCDFNTTWRTINILRRMQQKLV